MSVTTRWAAVVESLGDLVGVLAAAEAADKAEAYREPGTTLTYHPDGRVAVELRPAVYPGVCQRGDSNPGYTGLKAQTSEFTVAVP